MATGGEGFGPGRSRHQRRRRGAGWETPTWKCGESVGWTMMFTMIYDIYGDIEWCMFDRGFEGSWDEIVDENPDLTMV